MNNGIVISSLTPTSWRTRLTVVTCAMVLATTAISSSSAQDSERYRPNTPSVTRNHRHQLPYMPANPVEGSYDVLVDQLKGVMVLAHADRLQDPISTFDGLRVDPAADLHVAREDLFREAVRSCMDQPITLHMLNQMAYDIVQVYKRFGQPVVDVTIPAGQDITDGIVQIVIAESRIGAIRYEGNCWFNDCTLRQQSWIAPGQRIYMPCLHQELQWFNRSPFRSVGMRFEPGTAEGTTDVVYEVCDQQPARFFMGYNDSGPRVTSRERLLFGFNLANLGGHDRQLNYQYTTDARFSDTIEVHSLSYEMPIFENRDTFTLLANFGEVDTVVDVPMAARQNSSGHFWQVSGRYNHTLCEDECQLDTLTLGFDFKGANNFADYGLFPATYSGPEVQVFNLMAGLSSEQAYSDGTTRYAIDVFASPGGLLPNNHARDFKQVRSNSLATYMYSRATLERVYDIDCRNDFVVRATGQLGSGRLLPTEQLGFGGYNSVRGYDMRTLNGDHGYFVNLEYRTKPWKECCNGKLSSLTLLGFSDFGQQFNSGNDINQPDKEFLASAGAGLRYALDPNCSVRLDYAVPFTSVRGDHKNESGRIHLGAILSF